MKKKKKLEGAKTKIVGKDESQTLNLSHLEDKIKLTFDYEMNYTKLVMDNENIENSKILYYDDFRKEFIPVNYDLFSDKLKPLPKLPEKTHAKDPNEYDDDFEEIEIPDKVEDVEKANLFKRLVSKKKKTLSRFTI